MKKYWEIFTDKFSGTVLHPQFIVLSLIKKEIQKQKKYIKNKTLIDIGCGRMPYKIMFKNEFKKYVGLDHPNRPEFYKTNEEPEIFADITKRFPVKDKTFDTALLTQVIEYLEKPEKTIKEISRILKPKGVLIISTPFLYPIHDIPDDRNRFTDTQIKSLLSEAGFKTTKVIEIGGFLEFWLQSLNIFLLKRIMDILQSKKSVFSLTYLLLILITAPPIIIITNSIFVLTKNINLQKYPNYFPLDYIVIGTKQ
jgi:SAM-dependent methyltransferase